MMTRSALALLLVLAASPALAQFTPSVPLGQEREKTPEEIEKAKATEDAYKKTMKAIPNAKASDDPWSSVRSEEKKPQATSQAKKKKTGPTAAN
jgi:hypothetical protein